MWDLIVLISDHCLLLTCWKVIFGAPKTFQGFGISLEIELSNGRHI